MVELAVVAADITERPCDLLLLKHADGFYGLDAVISKRLGFSEGVPEGEATLLPGRNVAATKVLYIGVGPLHQFRYPELRMFGRRALAVAAHRARNTRVICTPIHGPGYGLDEREAFLSLIGGFLDGIKDGTFLPDLARIEIVELSSRKATRLQTLLSDFIGSPTPFSGQEISQGSPQIFSLSEIETQGFASFGVQSEHKVKLFVAMPFAQEHSDVWDIAIQESCHAAGILCERLDEQAYTGDVLTQITARIRNGSGVLALLNDANPNVFLEIGFAWGTGKPTILLVKKGLPLPFDVQGQKYIQYASIANLRSLLTAELIALHSQNAFKDEAKEHPASAGQHLNDEDKPHFTPRMASRGSGRQGLEDADKLERELGRFSAGQLVQVTWHPEKRHGSTDYGVVVEAYSSTRLYNDKPSARVVFTNARDGKLEIAATDRDQVTVINQLPDPLPAPDQGPR